jgi:hypothetical protein
LYTSRPLGVIFNQLGWYLKKGSQGSSVFTKTGHQLENVTYCASVSALIIMIILICGFLQHSTKEDSVEAITPPLLFLVYDLLALI